MMYLIQLLNYQKYIYSPSIFLRMSLIKYSKHDINTLSDNIIILTLNSRSWNI